MVESRNSLGLVSDSNLRQASVTLITDSLAVAFVVCGSMS